MAQSSDSGLQKEGSVRSVGHKNCMEAIIEQSGLMHPSAMPLLGYCRLFNRTFGPFSPTSHAHCSDRSRKDEEPVGGDPGRGPAPHSCFLIERSTVILGSSRHSR